MGIQDANGQDTRKITLSNFTVEVNQGRIEYDRIISDEVVDLEEKSIHVFKHEDFEYNVQFRFKRDGNRIKVRRKSEVILSDGKVIKGKTKKEVQFMSASAPGEFEFPVAENFVLDKDQISTFFISYRTKVNYK